MPAHLAVGLLELNDDLTLFGRQAARRGFSARCYGAQRDLKRFFSGRVVRALRAPARCRKQFGKRGQGRAGGRGQHGKDSFPLFSSAAADRRRPDFQTAGRLYPSDPSRSRRRHQRQQCRTRRSKRLRVNFFLSGVCISSLILAQCRRRTKGEYRLASSVQLKQLKTLLRQQGLGSSLPKRVTAYPPAPTGLAVLDALIGGGLPRGEISEITGEASSGGTSVILSLLAEATTRGEVAAYIDVSDCLDPLSVSAAGVDLERLLWVRCGQTGSVQFPVLARTYQASPHEARNRNDSTPQPLNCSGVQPRKHGETAWRAVNLVTSADGFGVIVLDLGGVPGRRLNPWRNRPWMRLMQTLKGGSTVFVILAPRRLTCGVSSLAVELNRRKTHWAGRQGISLLLDGVEVQVRVVSQRVRHEKTA